MWFSKTLHRLTPLHHLANRGSLDIFQYVVEHVKDIDINIEAEFGIRPLFFAIISQNNPLVQYLLEKGAKPDARYLPLGWTMLHLAAFIGNYAIVESLLAAGADALVKDKSFLTASILALQMHHLQVSNYLEEKEKSLCE